MMTVIAYCWMTASPVFARRPSPIHCCAGISVMRFYQPTRSCIRRFSSSVHIAAPNAGRFLRPIPTGRNTAPFAANEFTESRKPKANADGEVERKKKKKPEKSRFTAADLGQCVSDSPQPQNRRLNRPQTKKKGCTYEKKISDRGRRNPAVHTDE